MTKPWRILLWAAILTCSAIGNVQAWFGMAIDLWDYLVTGDPKRSVMLESGESQ